MKKHYELKTCPVCGNTIQRKHTSESWPTYFLRLTCSTSCGATLREHKKNEAENAMAELGNALKGWRIAA